MVDDERTLEIEQLTRKIFGQPPTRVAFPGGTHRSAFVADIGGALYVLAKRENERDAQMEAIVLKCLSPTGHVPKFVARKDRWLVQECIPGQRLPIVLDQTDSMAERKRLLCDALAALAHLREAAHAENLQHRLPKIGARPGWISDRIGEAKTVSDLLDIRPPDLETGPMALALDVKHRDFVKWDARPGNALVHDDVHVWFDWEDCGRRRALDDLTCVLCDEWTLIDAATEDALIERFLPRFRNELSEDEAYRYLMISGLVQTGFRLRLAAKYKLEDNSWWSRSKCLAGDKVGVTPQEVGRLCERGIRWAKRVPLLHPYAAWLETVAERLEVAGSKRAPGKKHAA